MGDLYVDAAEFESAAAAYRRELEISPESPAAMYRYGATLLKLGQTEEAVAYLERAVAGHDAGADALFQLGKARIDQNKLPEAETSLLRALEVDSSPQTRMSIHYQLANLYKRLGKPEAAKKHHEAFQQLQQRILGENKSR